MLSQHQHRHLALSLIVTVIFHFQTTSNAVLGRGKDTFRITRSLQTHRRFPRIAGGEDVESGQFPYMTLLLGGYGTRYDVYTCGATIIDSVWVVTSSSCLKKLDYGLYDFTVVAGIVGGRDVHSPEAQMRAVKQIVLHPNFTAKVNGKSKFFNNDIALVKVATPFDFASEMVDKVPHVQKELPEEFKQGSRGATQVLGWGLTLNNRGPKILQQAGLVQESSKALCGYLRDQKLIQKDQICLTGGPACPGDDGGPILCPQSDGSGFKLCGVVSKPAAVNGKCASSDVTIVTIVSEHIDFIKKYVPNVNV